jgi:hypothetical protein
VGGKRIGARKHIHFCVAVLVFLVVGGCSSWPHSAAGDAAGDGKVSVVDPAARHLASGRILLAQHDFIRALREYEQITSLVPGSPAAEEALFYCGLIYAHPANTRRDYAKSTEYLKKLSEGYVKGAFTEQANVMLSIMKENKELHRTAEKSKALMEESNRTIEKLKTLIEASKKVDIGIEDKKRESVR